MDDLTCDPEKLQATYRQFKTINSLLSGWGRVYSRFLKPALQSGSRTILDIGCGGGDIPRLILNRANRDGFDIRITATDTDERALTFMKSKPPQPEISVINASVEDLLSEGHKFDIVISNNVLHHIPDAQEN